MIAWKKSRECCNEVVCTTLELEESLAVTVTAMMNVRRIRVAEVDNART